MTQWWLPALLRIIIGNGIAHWLIKHVSGMHSRTARLFLQFLFCALFATIIASTFGNLQTDGKFYFLLVVGFFNGFGAYCQWRAIDISLSKNALFTFWDDIIAMSLGIFILNEWRFLNRGIILGIICSFAALILFARHDYQNGGKNKTGFDFYGYVLAYSIIWGFAVFFQRYFAFHKLPTSTFLTGWYGGAFIAASVIFLFFRETGSGETKKEITLREKYMMLGWSALLALSIFGSMGTTYWSYMLAPIAVLQPIYLVAEMIVPALIGFFAFGERKHYGLAEWFYFALGITGGIIIAYNF